jgi:hypothetical protein
MHKNVEILIGRLATDAALRRRFTAAPGRVLAELDGRGLALTAVEREALAATDPAAFAALADALDRRLLRAAVLGEP